MHGAHTSFIRSSSIECIKTQAKYMSANQPNIKLIHFSPFDVYHVFLSFLFLNHQLLPSLAVHFKIPKKQHFYDTELIFLISTEPRCIQ